MAATKTTEKKGLGKKGIVITVIAAVVIIAIIVAAVFFFKNKGESQKINYVQDVEDVTLASMYRCSLGENTIVDYIFEDGSFDNQIGGTSFATGSYTISANEITLTCDNEDKSVKKYVLDGAYLIPEDNFLEGTVPDGDTFDASFSFTSGEAELILSFSKDGIYVYKAVSEEGGTQSMTGTYTREGNLITRMDEDGTAQTSLYVYNGYLSNLFYVETSL